MSSLQIIDVFDSYYEGRKGPFSADAAKAAAPKRDEEKPRKSAADNAPDVTLQRAA